MKIKIVSRKRNPLLKRMETTFEVLFIKYILIQKIKPN